MAKATLDKTWIYAGKFYGPGEVELPDEAHAALQAKGAFGTEAVTQPTTELPEAETDADPLADFPELRAAGYTSVEEVRAADDKDLLAVKGVGQATLEKIRAATQE